MGTVPMMRTAHAWTEPLQTEPTLAARRGAMHQRHRQLFDQHFGQDFDERHRRFLDNFHRYVGDFNRRFDNFNRHFDQLWEEMA
jgi:hypothetical protein